MREKMKYMKAYSVQAKTVGLQHGLLSVHGLSIFHIEPRLPAFHISQPPAAEVSGWFCPVRPPPSTQVPGETKEISLYTNLCSCACKCWKNKLNFK